MRIVIFTLQVLLLGILLSPALLAAERVEVRASDHSGYTRMVFEWPQGVDYTVKSLESGAVMMRFNNPASAALLDNLADGAYGNIMDLQIVSDDPLQVSFKAGAQNKYRHFKIGNRVIVDVYGDVSGDVSGDNKGNDNAQAAAIKPAAKPEQSLSSPPSPLPPPEDDLKTPAPEEEETAASADAQEEAEKEEPDLSEVSADKENKEEVIASDSDEAEPESAGKKSIEELGNIDQPATGHAAQKDVESEKDWQESGYAPDEAELAGMHQINAGRSNLVTVSGTQSMGMAVFVSDRHLFMINDMPDLILKPQITGPEANLLRPLQRENVDGAIVFKTPMPDAMYVRTQGGGVLWRIVVGYREPRYDEILPERYVGADGKISMLWNLKSARKVVDVVDPASGLPLKVVTVEGSIDHIRTPMHFVDFDVLFSAAGLVVRPKVDDLNVEILRNGTVEISRPGGLSLSSQRIVERELEEREQQDDRVQQDIVLINPDERIYDFQGWQMGGEGAITQNRTVILSSLPEENTAMQVEGLLTLARMFAANGYGSEALGFLSTASGIIPDIATSIEFLALRGAARALAGKHEEAFADLSKPDLANVKEIRFWRTFALAGVEDWQQAIDTIPSDIDMLYSYPPMVVSRIGLALLEVALRAGDVNMAGELIALLKKHRDSMFDEQMAALKYLQGERERQLGNVDKTIEFWEPLAEGTDDLYRVRAGLALTRLELEQGLIDNKKAIDNLEWLRYAWRGDKLEAQINYWLGLSYFQHDEFARGLNIMREAATLAQSSNLGPRIAEKMTDVFADLFLGERLQEVSPLDAAALYEQFPELLPSGRRGDLVVQKLAERMVQADLLDRAADLLEQQFNHRLEGADAFRVGVRLAAIHLLDNNPGDALDVLERVTALYEGLPEDQKTPERFKEMRLLEARALSRQGRPDQAIVLLKGMGQDPDVNRLRADIAWNAGYWDDAAKALEDVLIDQEIVLSRALSEENANLILQRAVALNLSNDRIGLSNIREKYAQVMGDTDKVKLFELITRPRKSTLLADRKAMLSAVSEIDLFSEFLNSYRAVLAPSN